jgi:hypothetical protein
MDCFARAHFGDKAQSIKPGLGWLLHPNLPLKAWASPR